MSKTHLERLAELRDANEQTRALVAKIGGMLKELQLEIQVSHPDDERQPEIKP